MSLKRREVLRMVAAVPAAAWLGNAVAASEAVRWLFVYDDESHASLADSLARRGVAAAPGSLSKLLPADGDCVRFARECLASAPEVIHGVLRPASFLVIAGTAEEAGFRAIEERMQRSPRGSGQVLFSMQHRSRLRGTFRGT
jgi:hypothetical protein